MLKPPKCLYLKHFSGFSTFRVSFFTPKFNQQFILFLMPHSGRYFLRFWRDLVPNSSIWGPPWRQLGSKMAPRITQVAQNMRNFLKNGPCFSRPRRRFECNERRFECNVARCTQNIARATCNGSFVERIYILIEL